MANKAKPVIGIVATYQGVFRKGDASTLRRTYTDKIAQAGGMSLIVPARPLNKEDITQVLSRVDGVVLAGGADVHPKFYCEEPQRDLGYVDLVRDDFEIALAQRCLELDKPIFGICRGMQVLNVAMGGTLYQHLGNFLDEHVQHMQMSADGSGIHSVHIQDGTFLQKIYGDKAFVNSYHHQGLHEMADSLEPIAWSRDRLIEAVVHAERPHVFGVQWHPEISEDEEDHGLFRYFIERI